MSTFSIRTQLGFRDLSTSITRYRLWLHLGWSDIQQRYRGSVLGPLWITVSMFIIVTALGVVYSRLFHQEIHEFIPFLTAGLLAWTFISTVLIESTDTYISSKNYIENMKMPYIIFVFRLVWRNIIIFFHNIVVF